LHAEVSRCFTKFRASRQAATAGIQAIGTWPQIRIVPGELPRIVNEAESALLGLGREIYQRGGMMVRPVLSPLKAADDRDTMTWRLVPVTQPYLVEALTCAAQFLRYDARAKAFAPCDAPEQVAETYLARQGAWQLPVLSGVCNAPFLRVDGTI